MSNEPELISYMGSGPLRSQLGIIVVPNGFTDKRSQHICYMPVRYKLDKTFNFSPSKP